VGANDDNNDNDNDSKQIVKVVFTMDIATEY